MESFIPPGAVALTCGKGIQKGMDTFAQGLQVTAIGMALVFLSLILVAVLIWALDRIFRPRLAEASSAVPASAAPAVLEKPQAETASKDLEAYAAAVAVAIALRQQAAAKAASERSSTVARVPLPWERSHGEEILEGEIITVIDVDPGPGNWKAKGRLEAMK